MNVYLDNAATTPMDAEVIELMHQLMLSNYGNPSSIHRLGREAKVIVEQARTSIANLLKVTPAEIFFTSGGTEGINTIISSLIQGGEITRVITSPVEHPAMLDSIKYHCEKQGVELVLLSVDEKAHIEVKELEAVLEQSQDKTLVSLMHANNELGTLLPLKKVSELCKQYGALFFSDTVQTMGKFRNDLSSKMLDFAVASAHKFHGPKGVGFMYINGNHKITPLLLGGSQERNMRASTENMIAIAGMAKALELAYQQMEEVSERLDKFKQYLIDRVAKEVPQATILSDVSGLPHILNIGIPKASSSEMLLMKFDMKGVFVSGGSACSSGAIKDSRIIEAVGMADKYRSIRLSMSRFTQKEELDAFMEVLKNI